MNIFSQFVSNHSIAALVIGVIVVGRILTRDIGRANKFIDEVNAARTTVSQVWDGVDRRGQNRAKNIVRPAFRLAVIEAKKNKIVSVDLKTGTSD